MKEKTLEERFTEKFGYLFVHKSAILTYKRAILSFIEEECQRREKAERERIRYGVENLWQHTSPERIGEMMAGGTLISRKEVLNILSTPSEKVIDKEK